MKAASGNPWLVNGGRALAIAAIAVGLELGVTRGALDQIFFSSPSSIYRAFAEMMRSGQLQVHVWTTFYEVILGFAAGSVLGTFCGLAMSRLRLVAQIVVPFFLALYGLPSIVLAPLFILWFGIGVMSKVAISVYVIFFAVFIAVYMAALYTDQELVDAVRVMGASPRQVFFKVIVPATAPNIYAALKLGIGLALIGAIAGEFIAAREGLGYMIFYATGTLDTPTVYLGIIVLALFSLLLQGGVNVLGRFLVRWKFRDEK
jgi:NitT/TauT family transport system permease protein